MTHPTNGAYRIPLVKDNDSASGELPSEVRGQRRVLSDNLRRLFTFYKTIGGRPGSGAALERACGVSNSTISRYCNGESAANTDDLKWISVAYDLQVWQLLYPGLDPASPPRVWTEKDEEENRRILEAAIKLVHSTGGEDAIKDRTATGADRGRAADRHVPSKGPIHAGKKA